ncbi:MAG TPA: sigma 54-interacting transcriptional regulator [Acidobacteriota bacterium]|nr:sigma 54-interacting transcriptional regulator [Acidobacteriota bacterium]
MRFHLWCHALDPGADGQADALTDALRSSGVSIDRPGRAYHAAQSGIDGPGVVLFGSAMPTLEEFIDDVSRAGRERVIALGIEAGSGPLAGAWRLLRAGASDVLRWRGSTDTCRDVKARFNRWHEVDELVRSPRVSQNLVGRSTSWTRVLRQLVEVAAFGNSSVLLLGETGTGKELAARLIHTLDPRPDRGELVILDCGNIVPGLSGSEFFGHERGAFTGAVGVRQGAFELADGGTLFLDEVGELPLDLQAQLLRVVQERKFKRVGGNTWYDTRFRLICATHRELAERVSRGEFRSDLYYRIASVSCRLPALNERCEDILPLASHFLKDGVGDDAPEFDPAVRELLMGRSYPGNVRDLQQLVMRMASRHVGGGPITAGDVPLDERPCEDAPIPDWRGDGFRHAIRLALAGGVPLEEIGRAAKAVAIDVALGEEEGNIHRAARRLGVTDRALQMRRAAGRHGLLVPDTEAERRSSSHDEARA